MKILAATYNHTRERDANIERLEASLDKTERVSYEFLHVCHPDTAHANANRAIQAAYGDKGPRYDWLVLMDDDIEFVVPRTLERLIERAAAQRYAIASVPDWCPDRPFPRPTRRDRCVVATFIPGYLQAYHLPTWHAAGLEPRYLTCFPGEKGTSDTEVCFYAVKNGLRIGWWQGAYVVHHCDPDGSDPTYSQQSAMVREMYGDTFLRRQGSGRLIDIAEGRA